MAFKPADHHRAGQDSPRPVALKPDRRTWEGLGGQQWILDKVTLREMDMNDYSELKRLAAAAIVGGIADGDALRSACRPTAIWDLVGQIESQQARIIELAQAANAAQDQAHRSRMDLVDQVERCDQLKAENEALRKDAELYRQVERAAGELPIGWEIRICVEKDAGTVELWDADGLEVDFPNSCETLGMTVSDAIDAAISKESD